MLSPSIAPSGKMPNRASPSPLLLMIVGGAILSICMGLRQSLGLFLAPMRVDVGVSASAFGFALALQNLVWGLTQPFIGMAGDRYGPRPVLIVCSIVYALGLLLMSLAGNGAALDIGAGILCGIGIAGCGFGVVLGAVSRSVPATRRVQAVGIASAVGSLATLVIAPFGQRLIDQAGWQSAALAFAGLALVLAPISIFIGGKPVSAREENSVAAAQPTRAAVGQALRHPGFISLGLAFFACGFQLQFITVHLPTYLGICGISAEVSALALGVIGISNAIGSYVTGRLGARHSPRQLLVLIYLLRTLAIAGFVACPTSSISTLAFASVMGLLWLGVVPLVSGLIARMFGLRHFNTLFGIAFLSHQVGGFAGAWLGGLSYDLTASYVLAWAAMIVVGLLACLLQWSMDDRDCAPYPVLQSDAGLSR
ncbi:MFS transporter [Mesorhizobium sp. B2-3-4]|uniref:MFS transporter n=1 Tax=Mesorhizobium sp. B2-3-4 TaxID=2589959 RepID=UPI0011282C42|nr:MFS transporter [Mesorhizobium sp. B2-3-4]TPM40487.1 MFS transporter [Mesorhizobium sp. B2-3-4]